jgi:hypothetical protein
LALVPPLPVGFLPPRRLELGLRAGLAAAVERPAAGFRAVEARLAPPVELLARDELAFFAGPRLAVERLAVERLEAVLRPPLEDFAPPLREDDEELPRDDEAPPLLALALPSIVHLPDITR